MGIHKHSEAALETIAPGRTRYLAHTDHLMIVVLDASDGPRLEPDPPHSHPHEQVTFVAEGEVNFLMDGEVHHLVKGDLVTAPPNVPHCIQPLTPHVRLVDVFTPIREDFLKK